MKQIQNLGFKVNTQKNSRSKNDRCNFEGDNRLMRKAKASFKAKREQFRFADIESDYDYAI